MYAGLIAFTQIEDTADEVNARTAFAILDTIVLNLISC